MKVYTLYCFCLAFFTVTITNAQVSNTSTQSNQAKAGAPANKTAVAQKPVSMSQFGDSVKYAVNDFKTSMHTLFGNKRDTIQILIPDVDYDDANLSLLKESLKKVKGGKMVNMQYKSSAALLEVCFKGNSTQLWDQLPADSKKGFKIVEVNDNNMTLEVRK